MNAQAACISGLLDMKQKTTRPEVNTMSNQQKIAALQRRAQNETDPYKLRKIALELRDLGAWDAQYEVERKAHEIERKLAEKVW